VKTLRDDKYCFRAKKLVLLWIAFEMECFLEIYTRVEAKLKASGILDVRFPTILWYVGYEEKRAHLSYGDTSGSLRLWVPKSLVSEATLSHQTL
jgi:hypothetical protein